jgi:hypothetical protein
VKRIEIFDWQITTTKIAIPLGQSLSGKQITEISQILTAPEKRSKKIRLRADQALEEKKTGIHTS